MVKPQFKDWELINDIRVIERISHKPSASADQLTHISQPIEAEIREQELSFHQKVSQRAASVASFSGVNIERQALMTKITWVRRIVLIVMFVLGVIAVNKLIINEAQVNIFWLLMVLLGVNLISMLFYIVSSVGGLNRFLSLPGTLFTALMKLSNQQFKLNAKPQSTSNTASLVRSWSEMNLSGAVGKWTLNRILNSAWLAYLFGGLLSLLTILSMQQVNFVWGTTLLDNDAFIALSGALSALPEFLGVQVPTVNDITNSRLGDAATHADGGFASHANNNVANINKTWAWFLISSVLLYAVLPRFLLWLHAVYKQLQKKRQYSPSWNTPYFVSLRERLTPSISQSSVVDADTLNTQPFAVKASAAGEKQTTRVPISELAKHLPKNSKAIAYEWSNAVSWPLPNIDKAINLDLGVVHTRQEQQTILKLLNAKDPLTIFIAADQLADRGASRFFNSLNEKVDMYLAIICFKNKNTDQKRWSEWLNLAEEIGLQRENVIYLDATNTTSQ